MPAEKSQEREIPLNLLIDIRTILTLFAEGIDYGTAIKTEEWRNTMLEDFDSLHQNDVWSLVALPEDRKAIKNKLVFS